MGYRYRNAERWQSHKRQLCFVDQRLFECVDYCAECSSYGWWILDEFLCRWDHGHFLSCQFNPVFEDQLMGTTARETPCEPSLNDVADRFLGPSKGKVHPI